jgi:hypothetical protein
VNDDTGSDTKVVLRVIEDVSWIVINLNCPNIHTVVQPDVQSPAECPGESGVSLGEVCARCRKDGDANDAIEFDTISGASYANQGVGKWLKRACFRVVFHLYAAEEVEHIGIDVDASTPDWKRLLFKVTGKIKLQTDVSGNVSRHRTVEPVETFAIVNEASAASGVDAVM